MTTSTTVPRRPSPPPRTAAPRRTHGRAVLAVLAAVVLVDQAVKAWAWRCLADVHINSGGNAYSGAGLRDALSRPVSGAVLDVVDATVLAAVTLLFVRVARSRAVALTGGAVLSGWISNMGDRLGLHFLTAPGSVRGVVDFVPFDGHYWNLADFVILGGSAAFVAALARSALRRAVVPARVPAPRRRPGWSGRRAWLLAAGLGAVVLLAAVGVTSGGTLDHPRRSAVAPTRTSTGR